MKAAMARKTEDAITLHLEEIEKPVPAAGEVLVKVLYAGICGTDMHIVTGHYKKAAFPLVIGHEFVGEVAEVGPFAETGLQLGEKVAVHPIRTCGKCDACLAGMENICEELSIIGCQENGGFAEYVSVPASKVIRLPQDIDMELAGLLEPLAIAVHDVHASGLMIGQNACIIGGGPIGILIALVAKSAGASVVVSEINGFRTDFIRSLGIEVIDPMQTDVGKEIAKRTDGKGVDVIFEVTGSKAGAAIMTQLARRGGTIVSVGIPSEALPIDGSDVFMKELRIRGVRLHHKSDFEHAIKILASGEIDDALRKFITKIYDLSDAEEAMRYAIEDQQHFKVLLKM
ncbi:MAG: alcohol dehydrogenase catalytic domain-containing protein [Christensenella sp.]|uniref:zinc-dependent alcohol dehydrogenase n=1 Tax=Christensenella sp. TaxID=1935934 RepID=UPI002B21D721|nr:alcohol dehydrogenase catalytic domain-containing protein [Christensenella sp.]MEA5002842.1 alcohol dehydrogenase catalytic domain-containing protein [Christensenella sp.]